MSHRNERLRVQVVTGLLGKLHLKHLTRHLKPTWILAIFNLINGGLSIALIAIIALITQESFIFPSLGATAFILFYLPLAEAASPRNVICAHFLGASAGLFSLWLFGLQDADPAFISGIGWERVAATGLSLGLTSALMILCKVGHPPAGATALIVSLGLMPQISQLPILMGAVILLVLQALIINRLAGVPYPLWKKSASE